MDQIDPETVVVTASMVGAPAAQEKFVSPADMMRCVELFTQSTGIRPGGIVTNENGGGSTFNGWLEASMLGIPLIDAPCNGRAHPTGVMGSLNLHRDPNYITTMTCVGGRKELVDTWNVQLQVLLIIVLTGAGGCCGGWRPCGCNPEPGEGFVPAKKQRCGGLVTGY